MKKTTYFVVVAVVLLTAFLFAANQSYDQVRIAGSNTVAGGKFYLVCDSTDSFKVDTMWSDTIWVDSLASFMHIAICRDTVIIGDSANDSPIVKINVWTGYTGGTNARIIATKTLDADPLPDTAFIGLYINPLTSTFYPDSMVMRRIWFQTIVSDSFIIGTGEADDTSTFQGLYHVLQR